MLQVGKRVSTLYNKDIIFLLHVLQAHNGNNFKTD